MGEKQKIPEWDKTKDDSMGKKQKLPEWDKTSYDKVEQRVNWTETVMT